MWQSSPIARVTPSNSDMIRRDWYLSGKTMGLNVVLVFNSQSNINQVVTLEVEADKDVGDSH